MNTKLTEKQVLQKLDIADFRHLTKSKVITMASMIDNMEPEVARKALEQFPNFSNTMKQILHEYREILDTGMKQNIECVKSYYATCDMIISTCQKEQDKEFLSFEERCFILEQMVKLAKMKGQKDSENKKFIVGLAAMTLTAITVAGTCVWCAFGGTTKVKIKK